MPRFVTAFVVAIASLFSVSALANPWVPVASLPVGRNGGNGAVLGGDNKIYVLGGHTGSQYVANAQVFDGISWSEIAPLPSPRITSAAVDGKGRVYAVGGGSTDALDEVLRYDSGTNTWIPVTSLPVPRGAIATCTDAYGRIYAIGGNTPTHAFADVFRYDANSDTWSTLTPLNAPRNLCGAFCASNGMIYVFGGAGDNTGEMASIERYNPLTDTWTVLQVSLSDARQAPGCVGPDGMFYTVGGWTPGYSSLVEVFDPKTESITTYTSLDRASNNHSCVARGNYIYAIGGDFGSTVVSRTLRPVFLCTPGDSDGDQSVNFQDITAVLSNFNASCP